MRLSVVTTATQPEPIVTAAATAPTGISKLAGAVGCAPGIGKRVTSSQTTVMTPTIMVTINTITNPLRRRRLGGRSGRAGAGGGLAQLSDFNENNPAVMEYLVGAYEQWIDQGAAAFRVDTIAWMPHAFWKEFADRIRAKKPGFFMFGENFNYDAASIAGHTWARNGSYSVLDFPLKGKLTEVFEKPGTSYEEIGKALYLEDGPYANPYDLMTFYDNHDMARMNATDAGFIDAHNWLFTARGIPVVYYGSETGFMRGRAEHAGNRAYYGQDRVDAGAHHRPDELVERIVTPDILADEADGAVGRAKCRGMCGTCIGIQCLMRSQCR